MSAKDDRLWLTRVQAAELCGLSPRQFDEAVRPLAVDGERGSGKSLRFHGPAIVAALVAYRLEQSRPGPASADDGDPLMVGESPAIDEYRKVKTAQERIRLAEMEQSSIPRAELEPALAAFAGVLRRAGEALKRSYGDDAAAVLNDAVDEATAGWERMLADTTRDAPAVTAVAATAAPPDAPPAAVDGRPGPRPAAAADAAVGRG